MTTSLSVHDAELRLPQGPGARDHGPIARPSDDRRVAEQVARCLAAVRALPSDQRHFSLQRFDLARLRARVGPRWAALRSRAIGLIEAGLAAELGPADLMVDGGGQELFVVRAARERRAIERQTELLAGQVTARLCGTIPGGAIIRVATSAFDPLATLAGTSSLEDLLGRLDAAGRGPVQADGATHDLAGLQARFQPILHLRKHLVSAYRLIADPENGPGASGPDAALDGWSLGQAAAVLLERRQRREPALVVPVHYATLASMRLREQLIQACRQLPPFSAEQLVLELIGLPPHLPQGRVRELLSYLRPFCLALLVRMAPETRGIDHLAGSGARGICLVAQARPNADVAAEVSALAGMARIAGMRSMLVDVATPAMCRAAAASGIDHVSGDVLMPPLWCLGRAFLVA